MRKFSGPTVPLHKTFTLFLFSAHSGEGSGEVRSSLRLCSGTRNQGTDGKGDEECLLETDSY